MARWLKTNIATIVTVGPFYDKTDGVPEVDITHIAGSAVSTSTAQLGVNVVQAGGTAWGSGAITAASIATKLLSLLILLLLASPAWVANLAPVYPNVAGSITAQADGSIRTDVVGADLGTNNITVAACIYDDVWGEQCSSYVPLAFVRPSPASTPQAIRLLK